MTQRGYSINTEGAVALTGGTAKTILGVKSGAAFAVQLKGYKVGFDGISASGVPVLIEIGYCTFATNSPGTNSTSVTVDQRYGRVLASGVTAAKTWTTEPTVITPLDEYLLTPNGGYDPQWVPLGQEPDSALAEGFVIRCNAPANVNMRATLMFEPC